tara:strand:+ start:616 stop:879 length:264 start_codon:yes stop_codon:yes gene_type:complete
MKMTLEKRKLYINEHKEWINKLKESGIAIQSGFLVDENNKPGAGGLVILRAKTYQEAIEIIKKDPMIKNNLVSWELNEWVQIKTPVK